MLELRAADDLLGAKVLLDSSHELPALIGFHLQQFVEKKMKISLQKRDIDYPKTHDLSMLLELFPQENINEDDEIFAQILSQFAVNTRYGECIELPWDGQEMLEKAKEFVEKMETLWESS
ncbi:MAG: HEPN domain-containing protein [Methanomassiliicoccaceae archaeon]|nr:HEPN domain-containing protein [Methanomassiliicoccaceae archaeon]